jgi:crotonobetainyl-CoA:carnitine CoA-transferase CaiB-like acyl-CoA transferase
VGARGRDRIVNPRAALERTWAAFEGDPDALDAVTVDGGDPVLPSSFAIGTAAVAATAAATMAANEVWRARGRTRQQVSVPMADAVDAFRSDRLVHVDGTRPGDVWNPVSGYYPTADDRWIQLHTNFAHHLERTVKVLGTESHRDAVARAVATWDAFELEAALAGAGACATVARTRAEWLAHPQGAAVARLPPFDVVEPREATQHGLPTGDRPVAGLRVLDLTRVIAGPVATRTLAAHGADVLRVSSPDLPEIDMLLPDTAIGKRSIFLDLRDRRDAQTLADLVRAADVLVQSYRPGALGALGFGPEDAGSLNPDLVYVSLSAYSHAGPWADRRGYDTLVQTASGMALAEAEAFDRDRPQFVPASALDHATGYFAATGAMLGLMRRAEGHGGSHFRCSLTQTREWLEGLGRFPAGVHMPAPDDDAIVQRLPTIASELGTITYVPPVGRMSVTPPRWAHGPVRPGSSRADDGLGGVSR